MFLPDRIAGLRWQTVVTGHFALTTMPAWPSKTERCLPKLATQIRGLILTIGAAGLLMTAPSNAAQMMPTLLSGEFGDERLILAADRESNSLSGYYRDGECRVLMKGKLQPVAQYQRAELGESYEVQSWDPRNPDATFTTTLYSRARGSFNDQITIEPGPDDAKRPPACRWRVSLDRSGHVGISLIGTAVVARYNLQLFKMAETGNAMRLVAMGKASLTRDTGVWITKTYDAAWAPPGFTEIHWYDPPGTPHGGYVRTRDLHLPRAIEQAPAKTLFCMVLVDGTFAQLGECASANSDGTYTVAASTLRQLDFDRHGLAVIFIRDEGYAHVRRDGRALVVLTFDSGPDEFIGGLVRVKIGDKFGFANRRLKLVIPADYDGAYRFNGKRAWACTGCVLTSDGEHSWFSGGEAVCLDQRGRRRPAPECE